MEDWLRNVPGATELFNWFGYWPGFHDAEIVHLKLNTCGESVLRVHTWQMSKRVDARGFFELEKSLFVDFQIDEIQNVEIVDFSTQSIIFGLALSETAEGYRLELDPCVGLSGSIIAKKVAITCEPSKQG